MGEWTEDGKQKRRSMGTADETEAAKKLIALRSSARAAKFAAKQQKDGEGSKKVHLQAEPETLAVAVEAHIARKRKLEGKKGGFTEASGDNMRYAMTKFTYFVEFKGAPCPPRERGKKKKRKETELPPKPLGRDAIVYDISDSSLAGFYSWLREIEGLAEASATTYLDRVRAFGLDHGLKLTAPAVERGAVRREVFFSAKQIKSLLANVDSYQKDPERAWALRFMIYCGSVCGMRKAEISMCRPSWFDLPEGAPGTLRIPREMDNRDRVWRTKAKKIRPTEIAGQFRDFLVESRERWKDRTYMLAPEAKGRRYRYDFRYPLLRYFESQGFRTSYSKKPKDPSANLPVYGIHSMRHAFATALARDGVSGPQLSTTLGVTQRTAERYSHAGVDGDRLTRIFDDKTAGQVRHEELMEQLSEMGEKQETITQRMLKIETMVQNYRSFATEMGRPISFAQALKEISNPVVWAQFAAEPPRGSGDAASASERD